MIKFDIIVACCNKNGIGKGGELPWKLRKEMAHFRKITMDAPEGYRNVVIMGRNTWESIPDKFKPLPGRHNIILTSKTRYLNDAKYDKVRTYRTLNNALEVVTRTQKMFKYNKVFVIGGEQLYKEAVPHICCEQILLTKVYKKLDCDRFFPKITTVDSRFILTDTSQIIEDNGDYFRYYTYMSLSGYSTPIQWKNSEEEQYLELLRDIMNNGDRRQTRNAITYSKFGLRMEFDISVYLPVLTTKRVYWRGVVEELLWFLRGSTNAKELDDRGVKIWNGNTTREFLDSRGLQRYEEGDIGPTYGFGFRHYGAEYEGMRADYREKGFDQIAYVLNELKTNPSSRRMLINLWNPAVMDQMSLTPCACQYQFYVNDGVLSCQMYQRSADMFLGNPFNITSSSLLTNILARYAGLKVGRLIICLGDAHIYEGHIDAVKTQLQRQTRPFPILKIDNNIPENMKELEYKHFKLIGYEPHPSIKATMIA